MRKFHLVCLYFQFPVVWTNKEKNQRTENGRFSIGLVKKIDRASNSRYYFMLHPLSGVLHVKRKARKRVVVHIRSFNLCHYFAYGLRYRYLQVLSILRYVYLAQRPAVSVHLVSFHRLNKDEMIDIWLGIALQDLGDASSTARWGCCTT